MATRLDAGAQDGSLRRIDPYQRMWIISSAINGMIDLRYAASDEEAPPLDTLVTIPLDGLSPRLEFA